MASKKNRKTRPATASAPEAAVTATPPRRVPDNLEAIEALAPAQVQGGNELRVRLGLPPARFQFLLLPIDEVTPTQQGDDYDNPSSRELSKHIGQFGSSGRVEDYAPLVLNEAKSITDGNHRHFAYKTAGFTDVPVLVPVGPLEDMNSQGEPAPAAEVIPTMPAPVPTEEVPQAEQVPDATPATTKNRGGKADKGGLSAINAAAGVLARKGKPMSCKELIGVMAMQGLWSSPGGKTPASTLYAAIIREIKDEAEASRFVKVGRGMFAINPAIINAPKAKKPKADVPKEEIPDPTERDSPDGTEGPESLKELFRI